MSTRPEFLLVHGAWHGPWCWERLLDALAARGQHSRTVTLPGHGSDDPARDDVSLAAYRDAVLDAAAESAAPVIPVAHSLAGLPVMAALYAAPQRFSCALFVAAYLPQDGDSAASLLAGGEAAALERAMVPGRSPGRVRLRAATARRLFYADVPEADADAALARWVEEPRAPLFEPVSLTGAGGAAVPRGYVLCEDDAVLPAALQRAMLARVPCLTRSFGSSHSPMLAQPEALADTLLALATALLPGVAIDAD